MSTYHGTNKNMGFMISVHFTADQKGSTNILITISTHLCMGYHTMSIQTRYAIQFCEKKYQLTFSILSLL